jgi:hypothetical protein
MSGKKARPSASRSLHKIAYAYCRSPRRATKHGPGFEERAASEHPARPAALHLRSNSGSLRCWRQSAGCCPSLILRRLS